ncbi:hypothetical protein NL676_005990 [Syzygium grande]|nr:hypothetical protein NL676_005990 [Syzygium grande]
MDKYEQEQTISSQHFNRPGFGKRRPDGLVQSDTTSCFELKPKCCSARSQTSDGCRLFSARSRCPHRSSAEK